MNDSLWVDPERLGRSGSGYFDAEQELAGVKKDAQQITLNYYNSIGNDEEGQKFRASLEQGLEQYYNGIDQLTAAMNYVGEGLQSNGQMYGSARDSADEATYGLLTGMEQGAAAYAANEPAPEESAVLQPGQKLRLEPHEPERPPGEQASRALLNEKGEPVTESPGTPRLEPFEPEPPPGRGAERLEPFEASVPPAPVEHGISATKGEPAGAFMPAHSLGAPGEDGQMKYRLLGMDEVRTVPSNTMTSQLSMQAMRSGDQVLAGGEPLPEGYHLLMASELPGGEARFNVEDYADVVPLSGDVRVENSDDPSLSRELTEDGMRAFAVKDRTEQDPPQQPGLHMAFGEDGRSAYFRYGDE